MKHATDKPKDSAKDAVVNAMMKNFEKHRWTRFRAALHLHSEEAADRLTSLLALHLLLDRAVERFSRCSFSVPEN